MTARKVGLLLAGLGAAVVGLLYALGKSKKLPVGSLPSVLLGDSLAIGLASPLRMAGLPIHSIAISGTTIAYWSTTGKATLDAALAAKPTSIMVSLGTNDSYNPDGYASIVTPIAVALLKRMSDAGAFVLWIGPPKLPASYNGHAFSQTVLNAIRSVVENSQEAIWLDSSTLSIERQADQLHPTAAGYSQWSDYIVDQMAQSFVQPNATSVGDSSVAQPEPTPRPPPPVIVNVPPGWRYLNQSESSPELAQFAVSVLMRKLPYGDVQTTKTMQGVLIGAMTDTHWDDHVGHTWKWHRGVSLLIQTTQ
jgi:lysophospholipase L1-like esterase